MRLLRETTASEGRLHANVWDIFSEIKIKVRVQEAWPSRFVETMCALLEINPVKSASQLHVAILLFALRTD